LSEPRRTKLTNAETDKIDQCRDGQNWPGFVSPQPFIEKNETLDLLYGQYNELTL